MKKYCEGVEWPEEKKIWPMVDTIIILYLISAAKFKSGDIWFGLTPKDMRDGVPFDTYQTFSENFEKNVLIIN